MKCDITLVDKHGNSITSATVNTKSPVFKVPAKSAMGLYGNAYSYGNSGRFANRYYDNCDNNQGLDTFSRELLLRWSREAYAQIPTVSTAIRILSEFSVGSAYLPEYMGNNSEWGKIAIDWLVQDYYPNCCTRGNSYDFQTCLTLFSQLLDVDGDMLKVYGEDKYGFPLFQIIPSHRIKSALDNTPITSGQYIGHILSDGVIYTKQGQAVAYCVENASNLVNKQVETTSDTIFSAKDAKLLFDVKYFDKNRGIPAIAPAILQALSIQELDRYSMDKIKIESMIGLIEKTPSGEAPSEMQDTLEALLASANTSGNSLMVNPQDHAIKIVQGPEIRYVRADGGDIKSLATGGPNNDAAEYMTRIETQILSTIGVPHQLIFSPNKIGGRVTSAVADTFRATISRRQRLLDKTAKFTIAWALSKAMKNGLIPMNKEENMAKVFSFTHPNEFSLDARYDHDIIISDLESGICSLNEVTQKLYNKNSKDVLAEQANEQIDFYTEAKRVAEKTGMDINLVISNWKKTPLKTTQTVQSPVDPTIEKD